MNDHFGPGGALARALPEFEPRPQQAALAAEVASSLAAGRHLVAEAGTGVGKSLAYLMPALESGLRVVVATATKALQEQLLPLRRPARGGRARARRVAWRWSRAARTTSAAASCTASSRPCCRTAATGGRGRRCSAWLDETETGDRAELELEPSDALWAELAVGGDRCAGRRCPFVGELLRRGGARARRRGRPRDRQPRALLRAPRRRRRRAARARRGRSSTRRTGSRSRPPPGSAAGSPAPACGGSRSTSSARAATARSRCPRASSIASSGPASACCARSRRRPAAGACGPCRRRRRSC